MIDVGDRVRIDEWADPRDGLATEVFQDAIDACADAGGTVVVPSGEYVVGTLELRSDVTLHLNAGARVRASLDEVAYDGPNGPDGEKPFVWAEGVENVAITGRGVFDGRGTEFHPMDEPLRGHSGESEHHPLISNGPHRARQGDSYLDPSGGTEGWPRAKPDFRPGPMFLFDGCQNVLVRDVTLRDMPGWTISLHDVDEADVRGVDVDNHMLIPNCDGVSIMNSRGVHVSDCTIRSCDDSVTIGTMAEVDAPTEGVTVANCTLSSSACAIKFGSETARDIRDCIFENCVVSGSNRGLGVQHRDGGALENVLFSNIVVDTNLLPGPWWGKGEPIYVTSIPRDEDTEVGPVRNVRFSNVVARSENGALVYAHEDADLRNVEFDRVRIRIEGSPHADEYGGNFDLQPTSVVAPIQERDVAAVHCENATGVELRGVKIEWGEALPGYFAGGIRAVGVEDLVVDGFDGRGARGARSGRDGRTPAGAGDDAAIELRETATVTVRDCRARPGTGTFLSTVGGGDERLFVNNDLADAAVAIEGEHEFVEGGNVPPS